MPPIPTAAPTKAYTRWAPTESYPPITLNTLDTITFKSTEEPEITEIDVHKQIENVLKPLEGYQKANYAEAVPPPEPEVSLDELAEAAHNMQMPPK